MPTNPYTDIEQSFNIKVLGKGSQPMLFAHGYGCDQNMWRFMYPYFEEQYKIILFDYIGAGNSDLTAYSKEKYNSLQAYADDVLAICEHLKLKDVIFVGHSVSAMIGLLASIKKPSIFSKMILIGPSACYITDENYVGGFEQASIDELLNTLDINYLGWSQSMAPVIMGNEDRPQLGKELSNSFCNTDVANTVKDGTLKILKATGHCPNLSAPEETAKAILDFL